MRRKFRQTGLAARARQAALGSAVAVLGAGGAFAAGCPTAVDPQGIETTVDFQIDRPDFESQTGLLELSENPLFAESVASGDLPPVAERVPEEALVYLPYDACGIYGGTLRGTARAPESGTSEILSWRQASLVRIGDDMKTIVPNVAKSWEWNDDFSEITFVLRKGHKWSDGEPFTAEDVAFFFNDIVLNEELNPKTPSVWTVDGEPVKVQVIDPQTVKLLFAAPYPGLLYYIGTSGSYFAPYAPKHHYMEYHPAYNPDADSDAKLAGFSDWVEQFGTIYHRWKDAETLVPHALVRPTLESHIIESEPDTQRRVFAANPYYFKVDSSGQQLPYIDRHHERFLNDELQILAVRNGEISLKTQGLGLADYPILQETAEQAGYTMLLPPGGIGPRLAFNITHKDAKLAAIYGDLRFRQAISLIIDRDEVNGILFLGLGTPMQSVPAATSFVTDDQKDYMIERDLDEANRLLDEMGMTRGPDGKRLMPNGEPFTILWEYTSQFASPEFVNLMLDYFGEVGLNVNPKELTSVATRENAKAGTSDINMEWDVPFEPTLIADVNLYVPYYSDIGPLFGIGWKQYWESDGAEGDEPPAWAKRLFEIGDEWGQVLPGSDRYRELGHELIEINQANMTIIGTVGDLPRVTIADKSLKNLPPVLAVMNFNYGYDYGLRPDQWYFSE